MIKYHDQGRNEFLWTYGGRERFRKGLTGMASDCWLRELSEHIFNCRREVERTNLRWGKARKSPSPTPGIYFLQRRPITNPYQVVSVICGAGVQTHELTGAILHPNQHKDSLDESFEFERKVLTIHGPGLDLWCYLTYACHAHRAGGPP